MTLEILRPPDLQSCQCCHLLDKSRVHRGVELQGRAVTVGEVAQSPADQLLLLRIKVLSYTPVIETSPDRKWNYYLECVIHAAEDDKGHREHLDQKIFI